MWPRRAMCSQTFFKDDFDVSDKRYRVWHKTEIDILSSSTPLSSAVVPKIFHSVVTLKRKNSSWHNRTSSMPDGNIWEDDH